MKPFLWLASYPKSGNTWLRLFLAAYLTGGRVDINALPVQLRHSDRKPQFYYPPAWRPLEEMTPFEILALRYPALGHMSMTDHWPMLMKTHHAAAVIDGIALCPEQMTQGAVCIVRDPRAIAPSYAAHNATDIDDIIERMAQDDNIAARKRDIHNGHPLFFHLLSSWSQHVQSWMRRDPETTLCIRYEGMTEKPKETFGKVIEHIHRLSGDDRWRLDEDRLMTAIAESQFDTVARQERLRGFVESRNGAFFRQGTTDGWKDELSEAQAARIERDHGEVMRGLGYL